MKILVDKNMVKCIYKNNNFYKLSDNEIIDNSLIQTIILDYNEFQNLIEIKKQDKKDKKEKTKKNKEENNEK